MEQDELISHYFTNNGLSKKTEEALEEAWQEWKDARRGWMEKQIIKITAQSIIAKEQAEVLCKGGSVDECAFTAVSTAISVQNCISGLKSKNIVGLNETEVLRLIPKTEKLAAESKILRSEVRKNILSDCKELYLFMNHSDDFGNDPPGLVVAKTLQLGVNVQEKVFELDEKRKLIDNSMKRKNEMIKTYVETLIENAQVLKRILNKYKIQLAADRDQIICKSLLSQIQVLLSKIEKVTAETKARTYTKDVIESAKETYEELEKLIEDKNEEICNTKRKLDAHTVLGDEYQSIVKEFARLQNIINKNDVVRNSMFKQN